MEYLTPTYKEHHMRTRRYIIAAGVPRAGVFFTKLDSRSGFVGRF